MSLRSKVFSYLVLVHAVFAAAVLWAAGGNSSWLIAVEGVTLVSLVVGLSLAGRVLRAFDLGDEAARLIREGDFTARQLPVGDERIDRLIAVYNTIVDTLRGERVRVQEQQQFLEQVIGASPSGMVVLDFDGRITDINPAARRLLGVDRDAAIGRIVGAQPSAVAGCLTALEPGDSDVVGLSGARRVRCHRGTFIDRGFPRTFFVIEELTEETRRVERAAYEKLIRVMSHEVNNSITASNSLLESSLTYAAELPPSSRADLEQALGVAIDRSLQLNRFLRRFADVFRLPPPNLEPTELRALLGHLVTLMQARAVDTTISTDWPHDAGPVWVDIDRGQFEQVCLNILTNGAEAAGPGGWVKVGLADTDDGMSVVIDDSGPGPEAEAEAHLFTPFFSTKPHGQGIGLTLVAEILAAHGFSYTLEHLQGVATRFTIGIDRRAR